MFTAGTAQAPSTPGGGSREPVPISGAISGRGEGMWFRSQLQIGNDRRVELQIPPSPNDDLKTSRRGALAKLCQRALSPLILLKIFRLLEDLLVYFVTIHGRVVVFGQ
jgi:hypothetical protein